MMNADQIIVECLKAEGIRYWFGSIGEEQHSLLDLMYRDGNIKLFDTRHENSGVIAASGVGTMLATLILPANVSIDIAAWYGFAGGLLGLAILFVFSYVIHLVIAPYRQRNEARTEVEQLTHEMDKVKQEHTDAPSFDPFVPNDRWLRIIKELPTKAPPGITFIEAEVKAILGGNAQRVLGL